MASHTFPTRGALRLLVSFPLFFSAVSHGFNNFPLVWSDEGGIICFPPTCSANSIEYSHSSGRDCSVKCFHLPPRNEEVTRKRRVPAGTPTVCGLSEEFLVIIATLSVWYLKPLSHRHSIDNELQWTKTPIFFFFPTKMSHPLSSTDNISMCSRQPSECAGTICKLQGKSKMRTKINNSTVYYTHQGSPHAHTTTAVL